MGANDVARKIGKAISTYDCRILMADSNWDYVRKARMDGFDSYYGNPTSSHAEDNLDLIGIGQVLAVTPTNISTLLPVCSWRPTLAIARCFVCMKKKSDESQDKHTHNSEHAYSCYSGAQSAIKSWPV